MLYKTPIGCRSLFRQEAVGGQSRRRQKLGLENVSQPNCLGDGYVLVEVKKVSWGERRTREILVDSPLLVRIAS